MARSECFLVLLIVSTVASASAMAQNQPAVPAGSSSLTPEKMMTKEKAVEQHAKKRAECKQQAKEASLGVMARKRFMRDCMAGR
jgi:hypothetical protein